MTWNFYYDHEAENHFIADENGKTVAMVHQEDHGELLASAPDMKDEIARLTAERDQALARAAAAAMEMRYRAAVTYAMYSGVDLTKRLNSLPIDPDAQKALDRFLTEAEQRGYANSMVAERKDADQRISKAREDAIREAAAVSGHYMSDEADELLLDMWREDILALLNDGGRDE